MPSDVVPCIVAGDVGVAFVHFDPGATEGELTVIDGSTGDVRWASGGHSTVYSLGTDDAHVFVASNGRIRSYGLLDGMLIWESERLPAHADYLLAPGINTYLDVFTSSDGIEARVETIRRFRAGNGLLVAQETMDIPGQSSFLIRSPDLNFWADGEVIRATHRHTGDVAWEARVRGGMWGWPLLTRDLIIVRSGLPGPLVALNQSTGAIQWLYDAPIISNLVLRDGQVMALEATGTLIAVDAWLGTSVGEASFYAAATTPLSMDYAYCIATSRDGVFVYFGDGAQMIALEWTGKD
jgi:outer membrane protein assembly factor BamB